MDTFGQTNTNQLSDELKDADKSITELRDELDQGGRAIGLPMVDVGKKSATCVDYSSNIKGELLA